MKNDRSPRLLLALPALAVVLSSSPLRAGFSGTDVIIPAVARADGQQGAKFYSTVWLSNRAAQSATYRMQFYETDASNTSPSSVDGTLAAGETRRFDDVVGVTFGLPGRSGALRITSTAELLASSRTYSLPASGRLDESVGLFFGAVPASFAIGQGETSELQGVSQNDAENLRYNFGFVETTGQRARVRFVLRGPSGTQIAFLEDDALPFSRRQYATTAFGDVSTSNGRLEASVLSGSGRILVYGTQITNVSNDSAGFEMSFRSNLLTAGVTSLNGLSGPLTLAAGNNVTITPSGGTLTISATGGGSGLSLPFSGSASFADNPVFRAFNTATFGTGVYGSGGIGVRGDSPSAQGVLGTGGGFTGAVPLNKSGVAGATSSADSGVYGINQGSGPGVTGASTSTTTTNVGVRGISSGGQVLAGVSLSNSAGVYGQAENTSQAVSGVLGLVSSGSPFANGVLGVSITATGNAGGFYNQVGGGYVRVATEVSGKDYGVLAAGSEISCEKLTATTKSFIQPHPEDASKEIEYVSVEAPTSDVYFRGSDRLRNGVALIPVPEHFRLVARPGSYMTTVTAVGSATTLYVVQEDENGVVVRGTGDVRFHYFVWAERDLYRDHEPIQPNTHFRPESFDPLSLKTASPELKALLLRNGTLEPDGTYSKSRARQLGWTLAEPALQEAATK